MSNDTTISTLSKMVISFDNKKIEAFYQNLVEANPKFKNQFIDRVVGVFVKLERLFKHHYELEEFYQRLQEQRKIAETEYNSWANSSQYGKSLQQLLNDDPEIRMIFQKLTDLTTTNKYLDQQGVDFLIEAERKLDEKLSSLHKKQIQLDQDYIANAWHTNRRLAKILKDLAFRLPVTQEKTDIHACERGAQKMLFKMCEIFRGSAKPTPTGYHYIRLEDFIRTGVEEACLYYPTDQFHYVKSVTVEILTDIYRELEEFYSTFHGTQSEIDSTIVAREQNAKKLHDKLVQLKDLVSAYAKQLERFSVESEKLETYADRMHVLRTPKPPPTLHK